MRVEPVSICSSRCSVSDHAKLANISDPATHDTIVRLAEELCGPVRVGSAIELIKGDGGGLEAPVRRDFRVRGLGEVHDVADVFVGVGPAESQGAGTGALCEGGRDEG